jgi:hypothetical protein
MSSRVSSLRQASTFTRGLQHLGLCCCDLLSCATVTKVEAGGGQPEGGFRRRTTDLFNDAARARAHCLHEHCDPLGVHTVDFMRYAWVEGVPGGEIEVYITARLSAGV